MPAPRRSRGAAAHEGQQRQPSEERAAERQSVLEGGAQRQAATDQPDSPGVGGHCGGAADDCSDDVQWGYSGFGSHAPTMLRCGALNIG